jgi:transposase
MAKKRRQHTAQFKFRVALEAASEAKTISQIASEYEVHPTLVRNWKKQLLSEGAEVFQRDSRRKNAETGVNEAELYEQIGRLKMELEWLKKKAEQFGRG